MALKGPGCPNPSHSTVSKVGMERAYVRRNEPGSRTWQGIGWYCRFCHQLVPDRTDQTLKTSRRTAAA